MPPIKARFYHRPSILLIGINSTDAEGEAARAYLTESGFGVVNGWIPNRPAYRQAQDGGRAITEASYVGLRETAKKVIRELVKEATKAYE